MPLMPEGPDTPPDREVPDWGVPFQRLPYTDFGDMKDALHLKRIKQLETELHNNTYLLAALVYKLTSGVGGRYEITEEELLSAPSGMTLSVVRDAARRMVVLEIREGGQG